MPEPVPFVPVPRGRADAAGRAPGPDVPAGPAAGIRDGSPAGSGDDIPDAFGPLSPYLARPGVTDLLVNGADGLWLDEGAGLRRVDGWHLGERLARELAVRLIALGGRHIDEGSPCVDVRLRDGIRVHAVLPPIAPAGALISVRVPARTRFRLADLESLGMLAPGQRERLGSEVRARRNLLVTGAAGSGKTTLLAALLGEAPPTERIVVIEDVGELRIDHPHVVSLEARQANLEGAGGVGVGRLLREALRMRPDRLVLGECRGPEVRELLMALGTGHDGGAGTMHANSLDDVPARLEALGALAGLTAEALARQVVSAIDLVLHVERRGGVRRLVSVGRCAVDARDRLVVVPHDPLAERAGDPARERPGVRCRERLRDPDRTPLRDAGAAA